jgi:hypothetical protein
VAVYAARTDLVLDEAQYWTWSRELAFGYFSKPPMIAWVVRGASDLCSDSEACLRSPSPVLYTLAAFMIYLTGRALYSPRVGFWLATAPAFAPQWTLFERLQFLSRVIGWRDVADGVRTKLAEEHHGSILVDTREMAAELLYYLRNVLIALYVWPWGAHAHAPLRNDTAVHGRGPRAGAVRLAQALPGKFREIVR